MRNHHGPAIGNQIDGSAQTILVMADFSIAIGGTARRLAIAHLDKTKIAIVDFANNELGCPPEMLLDDFSIVADNRVPEGDLPGGEFVLASPLAGWGSKQWPLEFYRGLARRLNEELGVALVLNGPPARALELEQVDGAFVHSSGLPGLIHATRRAAAVLGLDSGPAHLAAALAKPGVAIFGPTDPARNGPYGDSFTVLRSPGAVTTYKRRQEPDASMLRITPDAVFEALKVRLQARGRPAGCVSD